MEENDVRIKKKSAVIEQNDLANDLHLVRHFDVELVRAERRFGAGEVFRKKRFEISDGIPLLRQRLLDQRHGVDTV